MCSEPQHRAGVCPECKGVVLVTIRERTPASVAAVHGLLLLLILSLVALAARFAGVSEDRINLVAQLIIPAGLAWLLLTGYYRAAEEGFFCRACGYSE